MICATDGSGEQGIKPYKFKMSEIEGFRYRVQVRLGNVCVGVCSYFMHNIILSGCNASRHKGSW